MTTLALQRQCDGCTFCCWAFGIDDVPQTDGTLARKQPLSVCRHACGGCNIHADSSYPTQCRVFVCPYLTGEDIHRPDESRDLLLALRGTAKGYIPAIPAGINLTEAEHLIASTRTLLAFVTVDNRWQRRIISLDSVADDGLLREAPIEHLVAWMELLFRHGIVMTVDDRG